jgi:hypothetical protein
MEAAALVLEPEQAPVLELGLGQEQALERVRVPELVLGAVHLLSAAALRAPVQGQAREQAPGRERGPVRQSAALDRHRQTAREPLMPPPSQRWWL